MKTEGTLRRALIWIAGGALLLAMLVDTVAMLGRHLRLPLLGSIELVQAAVLVAGCGALVVATLERSHARVHLLLTGFQGTSRTVMELLHATAFLVLLMALLAGTAWIAGDLWHGHEESELLRIPYRPLRVILVLTLLGLMAVVIAAMFRRRRP